MSGGNGQAAGRPNGRPPLSNDDLRAAVRAVLRDVLPDDALKHLAAAHGTPAEQVVLRSDSDLDAFVRRVATLCEDPAARTALREGRHGYRLASPRLAGRAPVLHADGQRAGVVRIESGAVTERAVARAAADGTRLVLGRKAVVTPLARDRARVLGVQIEKEC